MAINVSDVNNLHSFEFKLNYNISLLSVIQAVQGSFLPPQSSVMIEINESEGFVWMNVSVADSEPGRSGDGILAKITFNVTLASPVLKACWISKTLRFSTTQTRRSVTVP